MPILTTACPRNCYSTCTMRVHVEDGRIRRIEAHPGNRAVAEGVCLKGLSYVERAVAPDRLLHPLRKNPRTGSFERLSWDSALDVISSHLVRLRSEAGPRSVLYYTGSGTKGLLNSLGTAFWRLYGGCTTTYGDLCWPAGLEATRLTLGENSHNAPWDLANARLIVLWGKNSAETNIHQMVFVHRALELGARLVVIDPRRTETAERAELLLQPRPGTDGALALGFARLLIEEGWIDRQFVASHVLGFDRFSGMVREWTPEKVEQVTDVPAACVRRAAELIGRIRPFTLCAGFGMQRYTNSGQAMRAMIALPVLTGNIGKPGAGWQFANLQSAIFDQVKDPLAFYPPDEDRDAMRVSVSTARLGRDMLATADPALRMVWVERGNPVTQNPETHRVLEAFRRLDFRVVVDEFLTDTAREADIVLPAKNMFEQSDVIGAYWHPYIQLRRKVLDPPGEVKPESEVYRLLAERIGVSRDDVDATFPAAGDSGVEEWLARRLSRWPGLTLDLLKEGPVLPPGFSEIAFEDFRFPTASGKVELYSDEARRRWGADPLPVYCEPVESVRRSPDGGPRYPLQFLTPNTKNRIHSQFHNLRLIRDTGERAEISMNPVDAAARGVSRGDRARVYNGRGSLELPVRLDYGMKQGCVSVTNGWWVEQGGTVNFLSEGRETDMGHGAAFHDNVVEVERVESK